MRYLLALTAVFFCLGAGDAFPHRHEFSNELPKNQATFADNGSNQQRKIASAFRQFLRVAPLLTLLVMYVGTMITFGRWYLPHVVLEEGHGCATLYWGGDKDERDSAIYNAGEWPLRPETRCAGGEPPHYEFYGPAVELDGELNREWYDSGRLWLRLGITPPLSGTVERGTLRIPLLPTLAAAGFLVYWRRPGNKANQNGFPVTQ